MRARGQRGQGTPHAQAKFTAVGRAMRFAGFRRAVSVSPMRVRRQRDTEGAGHPECGRTPDGQGLDGVDELVEW